MKIIIIGAKGMLGSDLMSACSDAGMEAIGLDLPDVDVTGRKSVDGALAPADFVVNCAAYTNVDGAETHRDEAFAVNCEGAKNVAEWCALRKVPHIFISTDYVFDGKKGSTYIEADSPNPLNVYGASKVAGERALQNAGGNSLIVRTQSLFGLRGSSFVKAVMSRLERSADLKVVSDQVSSPTYTVHLAQAILHLLRKPRQGIVHISASGSCSWHEFAVEIAGRLGRDARITPVSSLEYGSPAKRPAYSVLDKGLYESWTGHTMPTWREGLACYIGAATKTENQ